VYRVLVGRPEGKKTLARSMRRWKDNVNAVLREGGGGGGVWTGLIWLSVGAGGGHL
jgi:hypothetical protein